MTLRGRDSHQLGAKEQPSPVNGQPGARYLAPDGGLINVVVLDIDSEDIRAIRSVVNPDKLRYLGDVAGAAGLLREAQRRRA